MLTSAGQVRRIGIFGHFGSRNSGNEATLTATIAHLRALAPQAEYLCICTNPEAVVAREEIAAIPITRVDQVKRSRFHIVRRVQAVVAELSEYVRVYRALKGVDMLIVPGTGLVTDSFGLHVWGPYGQFKWVLMARLCRARVLFVSVGAGPFYSRLGRGLVKASLHLACYRSYRDQASRDSLTDIGFPAHDDPIYPDLAIGLPNSRLPVRTVQAAAPGVRTVGIGLMRYSGRYSAVEPRAETQVAYLEALVTLVGWLLERGYYLRMLCGDGDGDRGIIAEFEVLLRERLGCYDEARVSSQEPSSDDVLAELSRTDIVVATRFHNVLLSLLLTSP